MASKRRLRRRECEGKARHTERGHAMIALRRLHQMHGHQGQLHVYRCPHCGGFHVGHRPGCNGMGKAWLH